MKKHIYFLLFNIHISFISAQELNCKVQVILNANTTSINQKVFKTLEKSISDFMNLRKWTDETTAPHQKINCYLTINITDASKENAFGADITIQSERPVFNTAYSSPMTRHRDKSVYFDYIENQALDYSDNAFFSNLTASLAFYAYYIIGMENESFSAKGGQTSFDKCQAICNIIPTNLVVAGSVVKGWQANEAQDISGQQLKIGIILATLNSGNDKFRNAIYKYHINGIDVLESNPKLALDEIELAIKDINELSSKHYIHKHFILTKIDEIINIFAKEPFNRKKKIGEMLVNIDPTVVDKVNIGFK